MERLARASARALDGEERMRLKRGAIYLIRAYDHNEDSGKIDRDPRFILNLVGRYKTSSRGYLVFENWWPDRKGEGTKSVANVLKKAVIESRELR